jgi:small subunit ribosomal protein S6
MSNYELMVIFTPVLSTEEYKAAAGTITKFIKDNGGNIVGEDFWGLKSLAYPIAKKTTGIYYVMEYEAETSVNAKLQIQMNRDESIMRTMVTYLDKNAMAYTDRKRKGIRIEKPKTVNETTEA